VTHVLAGFLKHVNKGKRHGELLLSQITFYFCATCNVGHVTGSPCPVAASAAAGGGGDASGACLSPFNFTKFTVYTNTQAAKKAASAAADGGVAASAEAGGGGDASGACLLPFNFTKFTVYTNSPLWQLQRLHLQQPVVVVMQLQQARSDRLQQLQNMLLLLLQSDRFATKMHRLNTTTTTACH